MNGESQCDGHHNERDHNGHDLGGELAEQFGIGDLGRTGGRGFRGKARRHRNGGSVFVLICRVDRFLLRLQRACGFLARLDDPSVRSDHRNATGLLQLRIVRMIIALRRRRGNTDGEGERRIHIFGGSVEVLFAEQFAAVVPQRFHGTAGRGHTLGQGFLAVGEISVWFRRFERHFRNASGFSQRIGQGDGILLENLQQGHIHNRAFRIRGRQRNIGAVKLRQRLVVAQQRLQFGDGGHRNGRETVLLLEIQTTLANHAELHRHVR